MFYYILHIYCLIIFCIFFIIFIKCRFIIKLYFFPKVFFFSYFREAASDPSIPQFSAPFDSPPALYSGGPVWASPFGSAAMVFGQVNNPSMKGAFETVAEAESHMKRGLAAAHHIWPSLVEYLREFFAVR